MQALPGQREIRARAPQRAVGTRELRRRGRPARPARPGSGLAAAGEDIELTRPGKSHPSVMLPGR